MADSVHKSQAIHSSDLIATLRFSQQAPMILGQQSSLSPTSVVSNNLEEYGTIEQLFFSCLQTGDDKSAQQCLDRLTQRFGASNERVMGLQGLYEEATATGYSALEDRLREYEKILSENPVNLPIMKRRIALLRSMSRPVDAISALTQLLETTPTDAEAWCELSDLYQSQGMCPQAIFSLEEALLITPNAWNIHARLGGLLYTCASSSECEEQCKLLAKSFRFFCRSVELCDDYLRGFYGLTLVSDALLKNEYLGQNRATSEDLPAKSTVEKLNALAVKKLQEIVRVQSSAPEGREHSQSEVIAARELLNRFGKSN